MATWCDDIRVRLGCCGSKLEVLVDTLTELQAIKDIHYDGDKKYREWITVMYGVSNVVRMSHGKVEQL